MESLDTLFLPYYTDLLFRGRILTEFNETFVSTLHVYMNKNSILNK